MRLTKQTGHAIRILIDCAHAGNGLVKVAEIAKRLDLTKQNVFKIVHILSRAGFVAAVRGPSGGVRLAAPANAIRVGDVVRAIEVTDVRVGEEEDGHGCDRGQVNTMFDDAMSAFIAVLDQHTLAELAANGLGLPASGVTRQRRTSPARISSKAAGRRA
jgi:Rrf2 family nitric oxide-sensitive transcriptional repressor